MKKWSSQWTQFMQLRKEAWKKFRTSTGFEPVTSRLPVQCSTNWAMKPLTLGAGQLHTLRSHVLYPEPLRFVWICLGFLLFRILYITGATKGYHFDLTVGFSHWSLGQPSATRSLRSTYLGCSFNFCLLHLTTIFGGSFATICCILVAGLKPAPWMFSQCCASCQIVFILICSYLQELIDQWLWN